MNDDIPKQIKITQPDTGSVQLRLRTDAGITGFASVSFGTIAGGPQVVQTILVQEENRSSWGWTRSSEPRG